MPAIDTQEKGTTESNTEPDVRTELSGAHELRDSQESAQLRLQDEVIDARSNSPAVRKDASDSELLRQKSTESKFENPYFHIAIAGAAIQELQSLSAKKDYDRVQIADIDGNTRDVSVRERRELLRTAIETEFGIALKSADNIDQESVEKAIVVISAQQNSSGTRSPEEEKALKEQAIALESLKHAPSAVRFAFAMYLAGDSKLERAVKLMDEAGSIDPEAEKDPQFNQFHHKVVDALMKHQSKVIDNNEYILPLLTLNIAEAQRKQGNKEQADAAYKIAIEKSDKLDPKMIAGELEYIDSKLKLNKNNPEVLKKLQEEKNVWTAVANSPALARINYADFLLQEKRYREAKDQLSQVQEKYPDFVKGQKQFEEMMELAQSEGKSANNNNPFIHLDGFQKAIEKGDLTAARAELQAAQTAADRIDRDLAQQNKKVIEEQLKVEKDPKTLEQLKQLYNVYDAFDHSAAFTRITLGRFELAAKNFNVAKSLFEDAQKHDPQFTARPELGFEKLLKSSEEPSTLTKVLEITKAVLKELVADAAAILAGAGAVFLTGWTGPAAIAAGAVAGSVVYTAVKGLMGEEIHWYTPLWGAVDGASGALGALARQALVNVGGKIVSKELAEAAVIKSGGSAAALSGMQGVAMADAAKELAASGLKAMGKDIGLWSRVASSIPFIGLGNAEYRAALASYRALSMANLGVHAGINFGTAATVSATYHAAHETANYYNGTHANFGDFVKAYGTAVVKDSMTGMVMGGFADGYSNGIVTALTANGVKAAFSGPQSGMEFMSNWAAGTSKDFAFGTVSFLLGVGGNFAGRWNSHIPGTVQNLYIPSVPLWSQAYYTQDYIKGVIRPALENLNKPARPEDILNQYRRPGPFVYPAASIPMV